NRYGGLVRLVDGGRFGFLLGESISLLERLHFKAIDALDNAVEFTLQARIGIDFQIAAQQQVEGMIEILTSCLEVPGRVILLARLVLLLNLGDQVGHRVGRRRRSRFGAGLGRLLWWLALAC